MDAVPPLRELASGQLWVADMRAARAGFEFGARMTVVRMPDGGLWLHSPVEPTPALRGAVDGLGPVRFLVSPSRMHVAHLPQFAAAYPAARVFAAPNFKQELPGVTTVVPLGDAPDPGWEGTLEQAVFRGSRLYDEVVFSHQPSGTLILTDLLFNIPPGRGWSTRLWAGLLGILGRPSASRSFGLTIRDRAAVRASLERILAWDWDRLVLAHGDVVESGGKAAFRRAFSRFLG
jgi:hypothetical protein